MKLTVEEWDKIILNQCKCSPMVKENYNNNVKNLQLGKKFPSRLLKNLKIAALAYDGRYDKIHPIFGTDSEKELDEAIKVVICRN